MSLIAPHLEKEIKKILEEADACIILTGAGMGVDSGLSVFRGTEGLWENFPEAKELNMRFEDLANPAKYLLYPEVSIPFYLERFRNYKTSKPHDGYFELLEYATQRKKGCFAVTSNVDGFFQKSYLDEESVYEIHGSINKWQCSNFSCTKEYGLKGLIDLDLDYLDIGNKKIVLNDKLKEKIKCKRCNDYLRPNILMFYDFEWFDESYNKKANQFEQFKYSLYESNVAIIEIGAGERIRSIKSTSEKLATFFKTKVIRINPEILVRESVNPNIINIQLSGLIGIKNILSLMEK